MDKNIPDKDAYCGKGLRANQNSAFRLMNKFTLEKLIEHFELEEKKRVVTMYIKNCRNSCEIKHFSLIELSRKLENMCFEIAYFSYTYR